MSSITITHLGAAFDKLKQEIDELTKKLATLKEERIYTLSDEISGKDGDLYTCPVLKEIMVYPITLFCGHTFERHAIREHIENTKQCPLCRRDTSFYDTLTISVNTLLCNFIDRKYPGYRDVKIKHDPTYSKPHICKTPKEAMEVRGKELNQESIAKVGRWLEQILDNMLQNGWTSAEIPTPTGPDEEIATLMEFNSYVKADINTRLSNIGYEYDAEWCMKECVEEAEDNVNGKRKRVMKTVHRDRPTRITIAPKGEIKKK